jgi:regulator of sigma E protease
MNYLVIVLLIGVIILIHEAGHLLAAKWGKLPVKTFSVGFGPRIGGRQWGDTEYRLSAIPVGGYVLPAIEEPEEYFRLSLRSRILFSLGGPLANFLAALACLFILDVAAVGFRFPAVLFFPFRQLADLTGQILLVIPSLFQHPDQLSGVVGIVAAGGQQTALGLSKILTWAALLNINLALLNLLPLMPLDGGKIVMDILHRLYPPLRRLHIPLALTGWALIIVLMVYVTVHDISRILGIVA